MKVIEGHLTQTQKCHIGYMIDTNICEAKIGKFNYFIHKHNTYSDVVIIVKDKGLIPVEGTAFRMSTYKAKFTN